MTETQQNLVAPQRGKHILILSAASKVRLVERFKEAGTRFGAQVYVSDLAPRFAAQHFADGTLSLPRTDDPGFPEALLAVVRGHDIGLVIPTRDGELSALAALNDLLAAAGATVMVSPQTTIDICQDKAQFLDAVAEVSLSGTPRVAHDTVTPADFPLFTRPCRGAGSVGARRLDDMAAFTQAALDPSEALLHPFIDLPEFSVDCLFDMDGTPLQAVTRSREQITAGESKQSTILEAPQVTKDCLTLGAHLGLRGHVIFQVFWDRISAPVFIEVNPRFGGASDCSIEAGLASPDRLMTLVFGEASTHAAARAPAPLRYGLTMLRYARDIFIEPENNE